MQNDIPNTYTSKKPWETVLKRITEDLLHFGTFKLRTAKQCHQIIIPLIKFQFKSKYFNSNSLNSNYNSRSNSRIEMTIFNYFWIDPSIYIYIYLLCVCVCVRACVRVCGVRMCDKKNYCWSVINSKKYKCLYGMLFKMVCLVHKVARCRGYMDACVGLPNPAIRQRNVDQMGSNYIKPRIRLSAVGDKYPAAVSKGWQGIQQTSSIMCLMASNALDG